MISIIIASIKPEFLADVSANISKTIGVDFEIISFNNANGAVGLCEIYNKGAVQAKYDILCFMHEDTQIKTEHWGAIVTEIFNKQKPGLLGLAGSTYKSSTPSGWFPPAEFGTKSWRINIEQDSKYEDRTKQHDYYNPHHESLSEVACVDGVWFCTTKTIALATKFDEKLLKGFHGYDIDFSLNVGQKHKILVTYDILLYHASEGNFNSDWLRETIKVQHKWDYLLPKNCNEFSKMEIDDLEKKALKKFLSSAIKNKIFSSSDISALLSYYHNSKRLSLPMYIKFYFKAQFRGKQIS